MVLQYIWPGCIRIPACCFTAKENDDYEKRSTKEIKLQAKKSLQGHVGTVILGLLAVYGLNTLGTILSTNYFLAHPRWIWFSAKYLCWWCH